MSNLYADSSFFVSVYLPDANTSESLRRLAARPRIWFTPFHRLEFAHALAQSVFHRRISSAKADEVRRQMTEDCDDGLWEMTDFPVGAFETGTELARSHVSTLGTRTLDTLHVACALELKSTRFWTFDDRQRKLARAVGLRTT